VIGVLTAIYLGGWMLTTCAMLTTARKLPQNIRPPSSITFAGVSVLAGAIWPVLLVGVAELGSLVTYDKLTHS
jgi:hypothetical protein